MRTFMLLFSFLALTVAFALSGCTKKEAVKVADLTPEQLVQRGKAIYTGNCIACHNVDPTRAGSVGPDLAGSTLALLEAKVLKNEYPVGYKPKRETQAMAALPHLKNEIPALAAYLTSLGAATP